MSATSRLYTAQPFPGRKLSIMPRPRGGDWLPDEMKLLYYDGVDILVSLLTPDEVAELDLVAEPESCRSQGMLYLSYPIIDRSIPPFSAETFALLEQLKAFFLEGKHVAVHCRMGLGRSALIAASVLVLSGLSPEQACEQLSAVRGYSVPETKEQRAWIESLLRHYNDF